MHGFNEDTGAGSKPRPQLVPGGQGSGDSRIFCNTAPTLPPTRGTISVFTVLCSRGAGMSALSNWQVALLPRYHFGCMDSSCSGSDLAKLSKGKFLICFGRIPHSEGIRPGRRFYSTYILCHQPRVRRPIKKVMSQGPPVGGQWLSIDPPDQRSSHSVNLKPSWINGCVFTG